MVCKAGWKNLRGSGRVFFVEDFARAGCWVRYDGVGSRTHPTAGCSDRSGSRIHPTVECSDRSGSRMPRWMDAAKCDCRGCQRLEALLKADLPAKNRLLAARLWTSHWICTGSDVQKHVDYRRAVFSPTSVQAGYNPCPAGLCQRKPLILWRKLFLSTTTASFTITTSFIYTFITVNSKNREQRA